MTAEKMIENVCEMMRVYEAQTGNGASKSVLKNPHEWVGDVHFPFYAAAARMLIDARTQLDKKSTHKATLSAVKRILKSSPHLNDSFHAIHEINGRFCACDGMRAVRLKADIASLPHSDDKYIDLDGAFPKQIDDEIKLPSVPELKTEIAANPELTAAYNTKPYQVDGRIWVHAKRLLDMLEALPGCRAYLTNGNSMISPVYFEAENGDGVLCPVRPLREEAA